MLSKLYDLRSSSSDSDDVMNVRFCHFAGLCCDVIGELFTGKYNLDIFDASVGKADILATR